MRFNDALNEHVATLAAAGASFCGARSMVVMKHVGLNIAADPLNYIGYAGVKGGMVIVVGTDPGSTCSTGMEDVHWYAAQTRLPLFEPHSVESIFAVVKGAFAVSQRHELPVLVFIPTRLCYNSAPVWMSASPGSVRPRRTFHFQKDSRRYILVGENAARQHAALADKIRTVSRTESFARTFFNPSATIGLITRGLTTGHAYEAVRRLGVEERVHLYTDPLTHPLDVDSLRGFLAGKAAVWFIEDEDGFLEHSVRMALGDCLPGSVEGKNRFPSGREVKIDDVEAFLAERFCLAPKAANRATLRHPVPERIGTFCEGCPHRSAFYAIRRAFDGSDGIIGGDIGCSSLPPFLADWLMCMNAGIGVCQGMAHVLTDQAVVSTGGDGSFFHAGLLSLQSAVQNRIDLLHIVFDNRLIAMTGHQKGVSSFGYLKWRRLLNAVGVRRAYRVSASRPLKLARILRGEARRKGVRVIWLEGTCQRVPNAWTEMKCASLAPRIAREKCGQCTECYAAFACPAIVRQPGDGGLQIDLDRCQRCGVCRAICPRGAITASVTCSWLSLGVRAIRALFARLMEAARG